MGLFSRNENTNLGTNYDVPADESYTYPNGFSRIMSEAAQNDLNIFSALIARDFEEAALIKEGYGGFSEEVITEGVGDIFKKIKEIFLKLLAKIKGIFKSFMAKFDSVVMKDSRAYYEKYKKDVNAAGINWSNFKCKVQMPKNGGITSFDIPLSLRTWNDLTEKIAPGGPANFDQKKLEKIEDDNEGLIELLNKTGTSITDLSDFDKEFHEYYFDDEEESDDFQKLKNMVEPILYGGKDYHKSTKKNLENFDGAVTKIVKQMDSIAANALKYTPGDRYKDEDNQKDAYERDYQIDSIDGKDVKFTKGNAVKMGSVKDKDSKHLPFANALKTLAEIFQSASTKIHTAYLNEIKFEAKQARSIYATMVAYALKDKNKVSNESVDSLLIVAREAAEYEFDSDFELA